MLTNPLRVFILSVILGFSFVSYGQSQIIQGSIMSEDLIPLIGATIQINQTDGTSTDVNGLFKLEVNKNSEQKILAKIRMLGYEDLDTTIQIAQNNIYLELILKRNSYDLPSVEIAADKLNLFFNNDWNILDFCIVEDKYYVISYFKNNRILYVFSDEGNIMYQKPLEDKYNRLYRSCQNGIHIIGTEKYAEVFVKEEGIVIAPYKQNLFDKLVAKCVLVNNDSYVFKELSNHNKKARYFEYPEPGKPELIKEIVDPIAAKVSESYYREIIAVYHATINNRDTSAIDFGGGERTNIIKAGEWSGDVRDLIINFHLHVLVSYYLNVECHEINLHEFSRNDSILIFDLNNKWLYQINTENATTVEISLENIDDTKKSQVVQDDTSGDLFFINKKHEVFNLKINKESISLKYLDKLSSNDLINKKYQIIDNTIYYITRKADKPHSKMNRVDLN